MSFSEHFEIATLGSILGTHWRWASSKFQLAIWSNEVLLVLVRADPSDQTRLPNDLVWKCVVSPLCLLKMFETCAVSSLNIWPGANCHGWAPTILSMVTTNPRMVTYQKKMYYRLWIWHLDLNTKLRLGDNSMDGHPLTQGWSPTWRKYVTVSELGT